MSVRNPAADSKRPAITTSAQPDPLLTTTGSAARSDSRLTSTPSLQSRTTGWHARSLAFDWDKPADRHRYQLKTGLPLVHAAILNGDWEQAMDLLSPEDLGMVWLAPASQRTPPGKQTAAHASRWASQLPSTNDVIRRRAIIEMAIDVAGLTTIDHACLHGANLLTLCLQLKVPSRVLDKVLLMACRHAPQTLNLPDASGRTPLGVAATLGLPEQVEKLLVAGAHPLVACHGGQSGGRTTPLGIAAKEASTQVYMLTLGSLPALSTPDAAYPLAADPACVKAWLARHSAEQAASLGKRFPALGGALLCFKDKSGLSRLCRMIMEGTLIKQLPPGLIEQVSWYRKHKVSLLSLQGEMSSPLEVAARHGPVSVFISLLAYGMPVVTPQDNDVPPTWKAQKAVGLRRRASLSESESDSASDVEVSSTSESDSDDEPEHDAGKAPDTELPAPELHNEALLRFILYRPASDIEKLLQTLPAIRPSLTEAANQLGVSATTSAVGAKQITNSYRALMTQVCRLLSPAQKTEFLTLSASGTPEHLAFLLSLPDFPQGQIALLQALNFASHLYNRDAFEIAAERSTMYRRKPKPIDSQSPVSEATFDHEFLALQAGSKLWFDRFIAAGLDLWAMLKVYGNDLVPILADMDPGGLPSRLKDYGVKIDEEMIAGARTEEGRQALLAMRKASGRKSAKA